MATKLFITRGSKKGSFSVQHPVSGWAAEVDFDDLFDALGDDLDEALGKRGYSRSMRAPGPVIARLAERLAQGFIIGGATARLDRLIAEVASEMRLTEDFARDLVYQSPQGKGLWELKRLEELEAGRQLPAGWRGRSDT